MAWAWEGKANCSVGLRAGYASKPKPGENLPKCLTILFSCFHVLKDKKRWRHNCRCWSSSRGWPVNNWDTWKWAIILFLTTPKTVRKQTIQSYRLQSLNKAILPPTSTSVTLFQLVACKRRTMDIPDQWEIFAGLVLGAGSCHDTPQWWFLKSNTYSIMITIKTSAAASLWTWSQPQVMLAHRRTSLSLVFPGFTERF